MNLKEARERSMFSREFTATKLYCTVKETLIKINSSFGTAIEFRGIIKTHSEWNSTDNGMPYDMPLEKVAFVCWFTQDSVETRTDDEGDEIVAQLVYDAPTDEYPASTKIEAWDQNNSFKDLLNIARDTIKNKNSSLELLFTTNVSFRELISSGEIDEGTWYPLISWEVLAYYDGKK